MIGHEKKTPMILNANSQLYFFNMRNTELLVIISVSV